VRIGLFIDLRNPNAERPWADVYSETIARVREGERRGLDAVWTSEHHGFRDGYLPQPLVMAAALATVTERVRLGTGIALAPLHDAQTLAEQAAVVDLISNGRVELGIGAGWSEAEFALFGVDRAERYALLEDRALDIPRRWREGIATPPPLQDEVPIWLGVRGPRGARIAGRTGTGLLWIDRELLEPYHAGLDEGGHDRSRARMGGLINLIVADDPEAAMALLRDAGRHNRSTYRGARQSGRPQATPSLEVHDLDGAARRIREQTEGLPVTDIFMYERFGAGNGDLFDRHLELITGELPALLADDRVTGPGPA
jgi:alkanesulfonate monooxygenase SsuD/methylene tetrahydromethanopterin reductase-like flavin-dependent oxidoreductase (luciferase family)